MSEQECLEQINCTAALQSLLYDIGLMPEQLKRDSREWTYMLATAVAYKAGRDSVPVKDIAW